MLTKLILPLLLGTLILSPGCADESTDIPTETVVDFASTGPYHIGQRETSLTYRPSGLEEERTLRVVIWYPTAETEGAGPLFQGGNVHIDAAPLADTQFPLYVFSHGSLGFAEASYALMEHFASHGFVVVAPDHTGNTTSNQGDPRPTEIYFLRALDISAILDWLYDLPSDDSLAGAITDDVLLGGVSFGGYTTFAVGGATFSESRISECDTSSSGDWCSTMTPAYQAMFRAGFQDPRVDALLPMAPGNAAELGPEGVANIEKPTLLITASRDQQSRNETSGDPYWDALSGPETWRLDLTEGGHQSFVFACEVTPGLFEDDGCGDDFMDYRRAHELINTYSLAFAYHSLFGHSGGLEYLNATVTPPEDVTLSSKSP